MRTRAIVAASVLCLLAARGFAQTAADPRSTAERLRYFGITSVDAGAAGRDARIDELADTLGTNLYAFVYYTIPPAVISDSFKDFLGAANKARVDLQTGASPTAAAATSTVARTGISTLFDVALEAGAITQTVDQNVVTIRTNGDGLARFLTNQEVFSACPPGDAGCSPSTPFKNLEVAASFTASGASTQTLTGTPASGGPDASVVALLNRQQFASATARYSIMNARDLRSDAYRRKWLEWFEANRPALSAAGADLLKYVNGLVRTILTIDSDNRPTADTGNVDQYTEWLVGTAASLRAATPTVDQWQETYARRLDVLVDMMRKVDPEFNTRLLDMSTAYVRYLALRRDLSATLITDPALTLEYTYAEPQAQAPQHTVRVAYAYSPRGARGMANPGTVTFNAALEWFRDPQTIAAGQSVRWKDAQAAVQFDRPLGPADSAGQLSIGAYYQYQFNPGVIVVPEGATGLPGTNVPLPPAGSTLLGEKGSLFAAQATLTLRLAGGVKVPIGVSWSNRTELVSGSQVSGHIGISFDTAPLFLLTNLR